MATAVEKNGAAADALLMHGRAAMREVAPRVWAPERPGEKAPEYTLCAWRATAGGFVPSPLVERMIRVTPRVLDTIGMPGRLKTLQRLARAGFVEMIPAAPCSWLLNLDSWYNHLKRVAEDADGNFWAEGKGNIECYREAL